MNLLPLSLLLGCSPAVTDTSEEVEDTALSSVITPLVDRAYAPALIETIDGATGRLHLLEYVIYDAGSVHEVLSHLYDAADRGVEVMVLADEAADGVEGVLSRMEASGVTTQLDSPHTTTHNKLVVADDVVLLGSHNFTSYALDLNTEGSVRIADQAVTDWYEGYFQAIWAHPDVEPVLERQAIGAVTPLYNREVDEALLACIEGASERLRLVLYAASYNAAYPDTPANLLIDGLVAATARGVDVRVVLDDSDWVHDNRINTAAIGVLTDGAVPLRLSARDHTTHAKVLVCDGAAIVGDANWSWSAFNDYNGTSVLLTERAAADQYGAWIDGLWDGAAAP
ncbi:MAG: hypothetical protein JXX28_06585 [Deltaproteobacteria bacterium]|nr:hypothetical protein [Deltaproteobacteria bacterium]